MREGFALTGIALGSILPSILQNYFSTLITHWATWGAYGFITIGGLYILLKKSPKARFQQTSSEDILKAFRLVLSNKKYLQLASIFLLSTTAAALPATIVLFYIKDVLHGEAYFGFFLMIYFLCGLMGLPLWYWLSEIKSKKISWMVAMVITIIGFIWATFLGPGDFISYAMICVLTGICLGADLSMPFSLLSDLIAESPNKAKYFGVWAMIGKSSIAIAGSLGLLVLGKLGYQPGSATGEMTRNYLAISYAFIPCIIKLFSLIILYNSTLDISFRESK